MKENIKTVAKKGGSMCERGRRGEAGLVCISNPTLGTVLQSTLLGTAHLFHR